MSAAPDKVAFDGVLVIGAGLAGLAAALAAAPRRALVISPAPLGQACASAWAQGGIAGALAADDTPERHALDTIAAGAGLVEADAARRLTLAAPDAIRDLAALGVGFDRLPDGGFAQSLEAAHSRPRVARVLGDQAGAEIMRAVSAQVAGAGHVEVRTDAELIGLLTDAVGRVRGARIAFAGQVADVLAPATVLATGGLCGLYAVTTTPRVMTGGGLAAAAAAGAEIADPEFVQFHPTAIALDLDPAPLASEALRGHGARLVDADGRPLMEGLHPLGDLAPRDEVARAVHESSARGGAFLDAREAIGAAFPRFFPAVFRACETGGVDPRTDLIPIRPAAHYHMGGIRTDASGATSLEGLFAAGECASTGVHGANRLASNSLLEAFAFGRAAGASAAGLETPRPAPATAVSLTRLPADRLEGLRALMSADAGVVRDRAGLTRVLDRLDALDAASPAASETLAARLVVSAALAREESRGGHFRRDFPDRLEPASRTMGRLPDLIAASRRIAAE